MFDSKRNRRMNAVLRGLGQGDEDYTDFGPGNDASEIVIPDNNASSGESSWDFDTINKFVKTGTDVYNRINRTQVQVKQQRAAAQTPSKMPLLVAGVALFLLLS